MSSATMNGTHGAHQGQTYGAGDQNFVAHSNNNSISVSASDYGTATAINTSASGSNAEIGKDEVGWYFVEQYYTTLSRSPEKLFLFYSRRSQYVCGTEAEKVPVCVGQKAIDERIRDLQIKDCKVRVSNVDAMASGSNIVIQVIGEMSNKSAPQRRFTQTFVLAEQANGYYVLNDIFRYILEEDDEEYTASEQPPTGQTAAASGHQEAVPVAAEPHTMTSSEDVKEQERDVAAVDAALEKAVDQEPELAEQTSAAPVTNGTTDADTSEAVEVEDTPLSAIATEAIPEAVKEEVVQAEEPQDPEPTPAPASPAVPAQTTPQAAPPKSNVPKTWASMVAGNRLNAAAAAAAAAGAGVAASASASAPLAAATVSAPSTAKVAPPSQLQTSTPPIAPASLTTNQDSTEAGTPQSSGSEWQTAGHDHGRKQTRPQAQQQTPADNTRGYIKSVGEDIEPAALKAALSKVTEVTYLDISRQKNCAFVDFSSPAGYQAIIKANPFEVNGQQLYVEERRVRPQSFVGGYAPRGGMSGRGRGGADRGPPGQAKGPFQKDGNRGGFGPRGGRGGNNANRGRGGPPQQAE